tara:strand:+ start:763 stop:1830 length:1068 start_codon:yes stop_codon:yes gene_type:complete
MTLRKNIIYSFLPILILSKGLSDINVVSYGWEVFERNSDSRTIALAQSSIAYPIQNPGTVLLNPALSLNYNNMIGLTHQSRMSGTSNSEFIGFDKYINDSSWVSVIMLYEGVDGIPDTRGALLDWGLDGIFGTFDVGEGNGSLDEGERLDVQNIKFFSQNIFGLYGSHSKIFNNWSIGIGLKIILHTIDKEFGIGAGLDVGVFRIFSNTGVGLIIKNLPSSGLIWESGNIEISTPSINYGLHHKFNISKYELEINPMFRGSILSLDRSIDSELIAGEIPMEFSAGFEAILKKKLFFRFGMFQRGTIASGIGLRLNDLIVDYAFLNDGSLNGIEKNHLLSVSASIDRIKKYFSNKI